MARSTSSGAKDWREGRRLRALEMVREGYTQAEVARALGVSASAVSQWVKRARLGGGAEALRRRTGAGGRRKLALERVDELPVLLGRPPASYGMAGDRWTVRRVAELIHAAWGVELSPSRASRLIKLGRRRRRAPFRSGRESDRTGSLTHPRNAPPRRHRGIPTARGACRPGGHVAGVSGGAGRA